MTTARQRKTAATQVPTLRTPPKTIQQLASLRRAFSKLPPRFDPAAWAPLSGLDRSVCETPVTYHPHTLLPEPGKSFESTKALYRSDNLQSLAIVPSHHRAKQPLDALTFYARLASAASSMQGGKLGGACWRQEIGRQSLGRERSWCAR